MSQLALQAAQGSPSCPSAPSPTLQQAQASQDLDHQQQHAPRWQGAQNHSDEEHRPDRGRNQEDLVLQHQQHQRSHQDQNTPQSRYQPKQSQTSSFLVVDDSPIVRSVIQAPNPASPSSTSQNYPSPSPLSRTFRRPIPSPLHTSTTPASPATPSPNHSDFQHDANNTAESRSKIVSSSTQPSELGSPTEGLDDHITTQKSYHQSDSSSPVTPEKKAFSVGQEVSPNDTRSVSDPVVTSKPLVGAPKFPMPAMAGQASTPRETAVKAPPRNSSMDSAISAISTKSISRQGSSDSQPGSPDISNLIQTAGSPEAVIQYLLKEKHSQSQQNSQLWRLVDKQRAMILGLNKDLERALKDKEKYRKKLKEVMAMPELSKAMGHPVGKLPDLPNGTPGSKGAPVKEQTVSVPDSPIIDSDSPKHSPIDMAMAPYPITPPADQPNAPPTAVGDILDPAHSMPRPHEHALDQFDHEAEERAADTAKKEKENDQLKDLPISLSLPPSRSLPSEPPRVPPPRPPPAPPSVSVIQPTPNPDDGLAQFPAPPPRKPPPAPLQLAKGKKPGSNLVEEEETDTDYDDILEVDEIIDEKRGRRRTREEDEREREILALKEAEMRSLSKKSKGSQKGTPTDAEYGKDSATIPASPRKIPPPLMARENVPASLDSVMNGQMNPPPPLLSSGLPSSPRAFGFGMNGPRSPGISPPLSPRMAAFGAAPLSPRPPRQPIPLPPNTPLATPPTAEQQQQQQHEPIPLTTPKPLNIVKKSPPPSPENGTDSPTEKGKIFKGLVTEEYSDLLLSPNALPSVEVRVASSRMKPSRASLLSLTQLEEDPVFTLGVFSRADRRELWRVEKDSASLAKLDQRLKQCPAFTARTPERSLFSGHAPAKLDARRMALDAYLDELLNTPLDTATALELCKYLSTNTLPPNADEQSSSDASNEPARPKTGAGGRPLISGYLTKRGKNFGGWKARFFILDGPLLKYYETPGGAHLGSIKLQNAQIGKQSQQSDNQSPARGGNNDDDNQYRHAFLILEPKKKDSNSHVKHVLCAESDLERDQWVETLLRWIDYRDPDDEEHKDHIPKISAHDRQASGGSERNQGGKKKKGREQAKSYHQPTDSDGLIGVSYDSTTAGDAPAHGIPQRPKTGVGLPGNPHDIDSVAQLPIISAPRDPQVISDSSSWGNKMGLAPPSTEEKKARKRSFFGFGNKSRTSSDGQDSLFGDGGPNSSTPPQNEYRGPMRQVFGAPLAEAVRFNSPVDVSVPLPAVVYRCIQYLDAKNATSEEGIFRLSGSNVVIKQLRERFNNESDVDLVNDKTYYDIHAVASLLKLYLRELPTTILTRDLHLEFLTVTEMSNPKDKIAALGELVQRLPQANATLLKYLIAFLIKIINNADTNKMTVRNVGIVFSPTLNIPAPVFAMFLQNYEGIFGIEPEEYELPSPISESDTHSQGPGRPSFEPHPRPSTSQGTGVSPHRQRLMQSIMDAPRASPTPPLLMNLNEARASPTPPSSFPLRQTSYEPQYLAQQNQQAQGSGSMRPSYDSGFQFPQGYDSGGYSRSQGQNQNQNAAYDRPTYASDSEYGGNYSNSNRRRESAVFMGGGMPGGMPGGGGANLNHQGSKSRLREESTLF